MIRKIAACMTIFCFFYLFPFFFVAAAPIEILKIDCNKPRESRMHYERQTRYIDMVHTVYGPFFQLMHNSNSSRDAFGKICFIMNKDFENFAILYWSHEIQYMDVDYVDDYVDPVPL